MSKGKMLIVHGGGPSPVINASLYGSIKEASKHNLGSVLGAISGVEGILNENFTDLLALPKKTLELLPKTPASVIGTSRKHLTEEDYDEILEKLIKNDIKYLLFNGGNGSMDTCGKIYKRAKEKGIHVIGIPKTIDNDIAITDHSPGFGSTARYIAGSVREVDQDIKSMPIHVCIIEAMGRNAGWITAASALARKKEGDAPHLIYLPEKPFIRTEFLKDVEKLHKQLGGAMVVVSEGIKDENGDPVVSPVLAKGRDVYFGDVSSYLSTLVISELGIKARSEKPGILGRASIAWQSEVDAKEAILMGELAAKSAAEGQTGFMAGLKRVAAPSYICETTLIPIEQVMMTEKKMPENYISEDGKNVTTDFIDYAQPLIGNDLPEFAEIL